MERRVLAKRRWRGQADDGTDFGFDLESPLRDGICFHAEEDKKYIINQKPEPVLRVHNFGNLHFPAQFSDSYLLVEGDYAVRPNPLRRVQ